MKARPQLIALATIFLSVFSSPAADPTQEAVAKIDQLILDQLKANQLEANPLTSDEVFVRRVHLDLIGRIPTKQETLAFLESKVPGKRAALVDSLIGSDGYVSHHYNYFADLLRAKTSLSGAGQSVPGGLAYEQWIKQSLRENKPFDKLVYELVTASGSTWNNPAVGYYVRDYGMPLDNLAITSQIFLGTQIVCAQCHDHPFDSWTQMDYYHLSAFTYGQVATNNHPLQQEAINLLKGRKGERASEDEERALRRAASEILQPVRFNNVNRTNRALRLPHDYQYDDAKPRSVVAPATIMGNQAVLSGSTEPIFAFGEWLTSPENPRFTKVIANRLWKRALGVGLIEPVDDMKENTVATNQPLMEYLESLMISLNYDMQVFQRILYRTETYQREATLEEPVPGAPYYFAGPILRRMSAEQIWDSIVAMAVPDADSPSASRELLAEKRVATVQLIAESVYDQKPGQFLKDLREVVSIQAELSQEIEAAQAKVAEARESGNPDLMRQASAEVREIRRQLLTHIEENIYRKGLEEKLFPQKAGLVEKAVFTEKSPNAKARKSIEVAGHGSDGALMDELAATLSSGGRSIEEGMAEIVGSNSRGGMIDKLVDALFAEKEDELRARETEKYQQLRSAWGIESREARNDFRTYTTTILPRMVRASELPSPAPAGHFLREFGQSDRELVENSNADAAITQSLAMLNGPALGAVTHKFSALARDVRGETAEERLDTVYLSMLSRHPTPEERAVFREAWKSNPESGTVPGIVWTLLNTRQFLFIQ